jgi:hypothetical protein
MACSSEHTEANERLANLWNVTIDRAPCRNNIWKRDTREAILVGLLGDCVRYGILDSTRSKLLAQADEAFVLTETSA